METDKVRDAGEALRAGGKAATDGEPFDLPCIRCGVCCTVYQVRVSPAEAMAIADHMGLERWDWVGRYCDPRWHDTRSHLIRHDEGGCVFLKRSSGGLSLCSIYEVRPEACRDWAAGVLKPACRDGLKRFWQVDVSEDGRLQGSAESLTRLETLLRSL